MIGEVVKKLRAKGYDAERSYGLRIFFRRHDFEKREE